MKNWQEGPSILICSPWSSQHLQITAPSSRDLVHQHKLILVLEKKTILN